MDQTKILIVEDERLIALEIATRLERMGYIVCTNAVTSQEAINQTALFKPDLILMDIRISGDIDGIDTAKRIRASYEIPIIFITAYADDETITRAKETLPYGYLTKPVQEKDLKITLEVALHRIKVENELTIVKSKLVESEHRNRTLLNALPDLIFRLNLDGRILDFNARSTDDLSMAPENFINKCVSEVMPAEAAERTMTAIRNSIAHSSFEFYEYDLVKGGCVHWYEARVIKLSENEVIAVVRDITQLYHARMALTESENRFRIIAEKTGTIVYDINLNSGVIHRDGAIQDLLGYTKKEFQGISFNDYLDLIIPEDRQLAMDSVIKYSHNGGNYSLNYRLRNKNGNLVNIEDNGIVTVADDGIVLLGSLKDVTRQKLAESELIRERDLFSQGPVISTVMVPTSGWKVRYVSPNVTMILGYTPDEMKSENFRFTHLIHKDDVEKVMDLLKNHRKSNVNFYELSYRIRKKNGVYLWFYDFVKLERDTYGTVTEIRGYMFDQTQLKQAVKELEESEIKYRTVADYTYNWEYWTGTKGEFKYLSPSVERITGYKAEDFERNLKLLEMIVHPNDRDHWIMHKQEAHTSHPEEKQYDFEFRIITKSGKIKWMHHTCRQIYIDGEYLGVRASNRDVTAQKEAEKKLITNTIDVEESERTRYSRELHDGLGPLLATIKLYFQWLAETSEPDKIKLLSEKGISNIDKAIQTVREVSHGLSPLFIMNDGFVKAMCNFAADLNVTQSVHLNFTSNITERFDHILEVTLYRIATELISNTFKYAEASEINIDCSFIQDDNSISFMFNDDGRGFDVDETLTESKGLGLINILSRVKSLNGNIKLDSKPGAGLTVSINFPLED